MAKTSGKQKMAKGEKIERVNRIGSNPGNQVWLVKPDKKLKDANPCLWMQAGVVKNKSCNNFYDCMSCKYDLGMRKQVDKGKQVSWQNAMRMKPDLERICRHSLTNRISRRLCAYDYQCTTCDFDQYFEDYLAPKTGSGPHDIQSVKGFDVSMGYYYHLGHAWAKIESGGSIRVGLDDFSQKVLGKADGLELPLMGNQIEQGNVGWGIKRKDHSADVLSPVNGVITEVNPKVRENPELVSREPYGEGWLFTVSTPNIKRAFKELLDDTSSLDWISGEVGTLESMIENVTGPLAADGGHLAEDVFGNIPELGWDNLTRTFLKTG